MVTADYALSKLNLTGAVLVTGAIWILSLYLISTFEMSRLPAWFAAPIRMGMGVWERLAMWRAKWIERAQQRAQQRAQGARKRAAEGRQEALRQKPPARPAGSGTTRADKQIVDPLKPSAAAAAAGMPVPRPARAPDPPPIAPAVDGRYSDPGFGGGSQSRCLGEPLSLNRRPDNWEKELRDPRRAQTGPAAGHAP